MSVDLVMQDRLRKEERENNHTLNKYRILYTIRKDADSAVYLAEHPVLHENRIIKQINKSSPCYEQLIGEAFLMKHLKHSCIPSLYDVEEDDENSYIVEQYMEGESLKSILQKRRLPENQIMIYLLQLCSLIQYLHSLSTPVLYLDLKPEHLILNNDEMNLVDFGSAVFKNALEKRQFGFGTPVYAAPEQYHSNAVDERSDIYGIGMIGKAMILQKTELTEGEFDFKHSSECSRKLARIVLRCLSHNPDERFQDVMTLEQAMINLISKKGLRTVLQSSKKNKYLISSLKDKHKKIRTIGILGLHPYAGATWISILLAYFFSEKKKLQVAVLECSTRADLCELERDYYGKEVEKEGKFKLRKFVCYKFISKEDTGSLLNEDFDLFILDLGRDYERSKEELFRCDIKLLLGTAAPWRSGDYEIFDKIRKEVCHLESWRLLINYSSPAILGRSAGIPVKTGALGIEANPLRLSDDAIKLFQELF